MKIEPIIKIKADDDRTFLDIAMVVDQDYFLKAVYKARNNIKLKKLISEKEAKDLREWPNYEEVIRLIETIRNTLHLSLVYQKLIFKAIYCNTISASDLKTTFLSTESPVTIGKYLDTRYTHFIVVSPGTKETDVYSAWRSYKIGLKENPSKKEVAFLEKYHPSYSNSGWKYGRIYSAGTSTRGKDAFRLYRLWYWTYKRTLHKLHTNNPSLKTEGLRKTKKAIKLAYFQLPLNTKDISEELFGKGVRTYMRALNKSSTC